MKDAKLEVVVTGLNKMLADYVEQININLERNAEGAENVMNRREQVGDMPALEERIRTDPEVRAQGDSRRGRHKCPRGSTTKMM